MRILHITTEFPPIIFGGLGTAVGGLVRALANAETEVGVLLIGGRLHSSLQGDSYYGGYNNEEIAEVYKTDKKNHILSNQNR
jgi:glycogen synthase